MSPPRGGASRAFSTFSWSLSASSLAALRPALLPGQLAACILSRHFRLLETYCYPVTVPPPCSCTAIIFPRIDCFSGFGRGLTQLRTRRSISGATTPEESRFGEGRPGVPQRGVAQVSLITQSWAACGFLFSDGPPFIDRGGFLGGVLVGVLCVRDNAFKELKVSSVQSCLSPPPRPNRKSDPQFLAGFFMAFSSTFRYGRGELWRWQWRNGWLPVPEVIVQASSPDPLGCRGLFVFFFSTPFP